MWHKLEEKITKKKNYYCNMDQKTIENTLATRKDLLDSNSVGNKSQDKFVSGCKGTLDN